MSPLKRRRRDTGTEKGSKEEKGELRQVYEVLIEGIT